MFECKVCKEKDRYIEYLRSEITLLRPMAYPALNQNKITLAARELDHIISGNQEELKPTAEEDAAEAASLLMGSYDSDQIEVA